MDHGGRKQKFKDKYRIESTRLRNYDYSSKGAYGVTICTKDRKHFFGVVMPNHIHGIVVIDNDDGNPGFTTVSFEMKKN